MEVLILQRRRNDSSRYLGAIENRRLSREVLEPISIPAFIGEADVSRADDFVERLANPFMADPAFDAGCIAGKPPCSASRLMSALSSSAVTVSP
ncbi:hypothetical protein D3X12_24390 [Pseudomonas protegens]|jgi:hypothetical protein|uniref:Uncharacterized protein n=1 Tax=Pseudomonas protegens TaxID=380021 RepID=A0ABY2VNX2_9PSED|nr:hypothetical protein CEP86_20545 [Pseudomonas protegens]MBB1614690.1 hypothetical protein [Pseudomonas sp. UMC65]MBB1618230.1 hypothetical protein [Pseudomonas sp. UME65]NTZ74499.1 hypothetical protein [Pseudomonas protegens]PNV94750.1 hypothetical protein C1633_28460 [Pseudomonas protegens]